MEERFFVTGALGCIGAWVVRNLVRAGVPVSVFDQASDPHRLRLILSADGVAQTIDCFKAALADGRLSPAG